MAHFGSVAHIATKTPEELEKVNNIGPKMARQILKFLKGESEDEDFRKRVHEHYMRMAMSLARRGTGTTSPNPKVGCVIVKDGVIVGMDFHRYPGAPHAEVGALSMAKELAKDSTLYVNLEPCTHYGRTPPCCPLIAQSGVKTVCIAVEDPFDKVQGKGIEYLRSSGIEVTSAYWKRRQDG